MYRVLKAAHLMGFAIFFGSFLGRIVAAINAGQMGTASFLFSRQDISLATQMLTTPGLLLTIVSGFGMVAVGRLNLLRQRWLGLHAGLGLLVLFLAVSVFVPVNHAILRDAVALAEKPDLAVIASVLRAKRIETTAGAVNLLLIFVIASLGVWKPHRIPFFVRRAETTK